MLMFRDGVSEGEFATVIAVEVNAFHQALRRFKADAEMRQLFGSALDAWKPKVSSPGCAKSVAQADDCNRLTAHGHRDGQAPPHQGLRRRRAGVKHPARHVLRHWRHRRTQCVSSSPLLKLILTAGRAGFDVYGAAHRALIGTTRATRYVVLHDEQGLSCVWLSSAFDSLR